jgi:hypothetical protein
MKFKPGQKVVCIHKGDWRGLIYGSIDNGFKPKFNEEVTIHGYGKLNGLTGVSLIEYPINSYGSPQMFLEKWFVPLMDISELTEILNHEPEHA